MIRDDEDARLARHAELQGFGSCAALMLEGYLLLVLAEKWNLIFLGVLLLACLWRMVRVRFGGGRLIDWSRNSHRVVGSVSFLCLGFGSAAGFTTGTVFFLAAVVVWIEAIILLSRWRGPGVLRALTYLSLFHVVLAAFEVRPAATAPLLLVYLFLVVRTLGVADRRVGEVPEYPRFLAIDTGTFAAVTVLAMTLFLVLPRPSAAGGSDPAASRTGERPDDYEVPKNPARGERVIGFDEDMALDDDLVPLLSDKRVALRVNQIEVPPQMSMAVVLPELRLRGIWFHTWTGRRWTRDRAIDLVMDRMDGAQDDWVRIEDKAFGDDPSLPPLGTTGTAHDTWTARLQLVPLGKRACFVPPGMRAIQQRVLVTDGEEGYFFPNVVRQPLTYRIEALVLKNHKTPEARVRRFPEDSVYLQVAGPEDRFRELAQDLILGKSGDPARILAIQDHLQERYEYTLSVAAPPPDADLIEYFLFQRRSGYCVHFATAMTMLLRSIGIPCRIAGGYVSQEWDPERGEFLVRQTHAHAWVEVPFEGLGWVPFDPTPLPEAAPEESLGSLEKTAKSQARSVWVDFFVNLESFDRSRFLGEIGDGLTQLVQAALGRGGAPRAVGVWGGILAVFLSLLGLGEWLRRRGWLRVGNPSTATRGPGRNGAAIPFYRDLLRMAARRGLVRANTETPAEFARRVDEAAGRPAAQQVVDAYYLVLFGRRTLSPAESRAVQEALVRLEQGLFPPPSARN